VAAHEIDRVLVAADVLEVGVEFGDAEAERGFDLFQAAAEDGEERRPEAGIGGAGGRQRVDRRRFNSLTGTMTGPSSRLSSAASSKSVSPRRPNWPRRDSVVNGRFSAACNGMRDCTEAVASEDFPSSRNGLPARPVTMRSSGRFGLGRSPAQLLRNSRFNWGSSVFQRRSPALTA
jgi:hypothetical protein